MTQHGAHPRRPAGRPGGLGEPAQQDHQHGRAGSRHGEGRPPRHCDGEHPGQGGRDRDPAGGRSIEVGQGVLPARKGNGVPDVHQAGGHDGAHRGAGHRPGEDQQRQVRGHHCEPARGGGHGQRQPHRAHPAEPVAAQPPKRLADPVKQVVERSDRRGSAQADRQAGREGEQDRAGHEPVEAARRGGGHQQLDLPSAHRRWTDGGRHQHPRATSGGHLPSPAARAPTARSSARPRLVVRQ